MPFEAVQTTPTNQALAEIGEIGIETLGKKAAQLAQLLSEYQSTDVAKVAADLANLARLCRDKSVWPNEIADHIASFALDFPGAIEIAVRCHAIQLSRTYFEGHANGQLEYLRQILEIAERWKPLLQACAKVEPKSLTSGRDV
jgi:hypothetical protein